MRRMLRVELARYRSRRAIALLVLGAALLTALLAAKTAWDTRPPSDAERATAAAQADMEADRSDIQRDLEQCLADPEQYLGPNATPQQCRDSLTAAPRSYLPRQSLDLGRVLDGTGVQVAVLVAGLLVIAASTFAGADHATGSITTQLLFEPRRTRVWTAKALAVVIWSAVASVVIIGGFWAALLAIADARDIAVPSPVTSEVGWHVVRAVVLAVAAALGAYSLTMLFRHTVGTIALLLAYTVAGELVVTLLPLSGVGRWTLGTNLHAWLLSDFTYVDPSAECVGLGTCVGPQHLGTWPAGGYLLVLLVVALAVSLVAFRHRDA